MSQKKTRYNSHAALCFSAAMPSKPAKTDPINKTHSHTHSNPVTTSNLTGAYSQTGMNGFHNLEMMGLIGIFLFVNLLIIRFGAKSNKKGNDKK